MKKIQETPAAEPRTVHATKEQVAKIQRADAEYIPKTITIRGYQARFLQENSISLSRFVQLKLDQLISKGKIDLTKNL